MLNVGRWAFPQTALQPADLSLENVNDVLHLADSQKKCRSEKSGSGNCNCCEEYRQLLEEPHVRPRVQPEVIRRPTDQRQQRTGDTNFSESDQHSASLQPARVPAHQRVEQKKVNRGDETC